MYDEPDFSVWACVETLSPHALACLILGVHPDVEPSLQSVTGCSPEIPDEHLDAVDKVDWDAAYRSVFVPLSNAVRSGAISVRSNGEPSVADALAYLERKADLSGWGSYVATSRFVKEYRSRCNQNPAVISGQVVTTHPSETSKPEPTTSDAGGSANDDLVWLERARKEFSGDQVTTVFVRDWIIETAAREKSLMTKTRAMRIARMLTPPERRAGGRPKRIEIS